MGEEDGPGDPGQRFGDLGPDVELKLFEVEHHHRIEQHECHDSRGRHDQPAKGPPRPRAVRLQRGRPLRRQQIGQGNRDRHERRRVFADDRAGERHSGGDTGWDAASFGHSEKRQPRQHAEEGHAHVDGKKMGIPNEQNGKGEIRGRQQAGQPAGDARRYRVCDGNRRRPKGRRDRAAHHHVGDLVPLNGQDKRMRNRFIRPAQDVDQIHRQRSVHEKLSGQRGVPHARAQQIGAHEHVVLVHVKVKIGGAPGEIVKAERTADHGKDRQRGKRARLSLQDKQYKRF
jgi:hypothetical protein